MYSEIVAIIKAAFPSSGVKLPIANAPKWLLWAVGPAVGLSRDFVT